MERSLFSRSGYLFLAGAMLSACAGGAGNIPQREATVSPARSRPQSRTFFYTGDSQRFRVPGGVHQITVVARGAAGAGKQICNSGRCYDHFGKGGRVFAIIPVVPRQVLYVYVGGQGSITGGFNGGGNPGTDPSQGGGYGGGGASDVRQGGFRLENRIIVAAGGGGMGDFLGTFGNFGPSGGYGGGFEGGTGDGGYSSGYGGWGGGGGAQTQGGYGGTGGKGNPSEAGESGKPGAFGIGGRGGNGGYNPSRSGLNDGGGGGGGGGGYYGGGGGGGGAAAFASIYGSPGGGGGGGSSYIEPRAKDGRTWSSWHKATADGLVVFSW